MRSREIREIYGICEIYEISTDFFFYPPITANLYFDILFDIPELSEQTLPHQWRLLYNWNYSKLTESKNSESKSGCRK